MQNVYVEAIPDRYVGPKVTVTIKVRNKDRHLILQLESQIEELVSELNKIYEN